MDLKNLSIALFVKDIEISKDFYINILEQRVELDFGKNVIFKNGLAIWEIRDSHIIPVNLGTDKIRNNSVNRFELYFETDNLPQIYQSLKNNNVQFLHEIHEEIWGQQTIRIFDPDNHLIEIGESMAQFVGRFYQQGLTIEQISERTFIPVEEVLHLINKI
jgi:catechol 2,3-dioxygenase-like lactoylglutathione lyase family enzyme